jgi:hypothetical protein
VQENTGFLSDVTTIIQYLPEITVAVTAYSHRQNLKSDEMLKVKQGKRFEWQNFLDLQSLPIHVLSSY